MDAVQVFLIQNLSPLTVLEWTIVVANIVLLVFSSKILELVLRDKTDKNRVALLAGAFRAANMLIIASIIFYRVVMNLELRSLFSQSLGAIMALYMGYLSYHVFAYFVHSRFGKIKLINDERVFSESYNSRAITLLGGIFIGTMVLISIVNIFGLKGLMEAGGVIGFIGVMLALTQGAWAPDVISGLIILNSNIVTEGDVVEISYDNGANVVAMVFRIKIFHVEVLDLVDNHRIMIRNARFRDHIVHNLSRFASAKGLRECLTFKIGYGANPTAVEKVFEKAVERAVENQIPIEGQHDTEILAVDAGDYAVEWGLFYYTKDVKKLIATRHFLRRAVIEEADKSKLSLATPALINITQEAKPPTTAST